MTEPLLPYSEAGMSSLYVIRHHDKGAHAAYILVPAISITILNELTLIEGLVFGGSYAAGTFRDATAEDIDFDLLYASYPDQTSREVLHREIERRFRVAGLEPEIRAPLARDSIDVSLRSTLYEKHPNTPFVVRNVAAAEAWGLE